MSGSKHKPKSNEVDLSEDDPLPIGNQRRQKRADQSAGHSKKTRSKTPPIYGEVEEAGRQQELTNREKPSHQKSASGNYQRHQSQDQRQGRPVELKPRAATSQQSGSASTTVLDFANTNSGRKTSIGSTDRNREKPERDINLLKGLPCLGGQQSDYRNPFLKEPQSRSEERAMDL